LSESEKAFAVAQSIAMAKRGCVLLLRNESLFSTLIEIGYLDRKGLKCTGL
jgi:hypothetical protein